MNLNTAIMVASEAHRFQSRWDGSAYILHPIRVMMDMDTEEEQIVAILHDVIEDTKAIYRDLLDCGFQTNVIAAIEAMTKVEGETYEVYIQRVKENKLARKVKLADIRDNLDVTILRSVSDRHKERINKYLNAIQYLS